MAATLTGALKLLVEGKVAGIILYPDAPPEGTKRPYVTVIEDIALVMEPREDGGVGSGSPTPTGYAIETIQVDLWQDWRDANDVTLESATLPDQITEAIDGAQLVGAPKRVYGVYQRGRVRILDRNSRIVHHAYTLDVHRVI